MQLISHRGFWRERAEQNTMPAFARSFAGGFGIETDIRDLDGTLVISHDPPRRGALPFSELLALHQREGQGVTLALNVKADGLQPAIAEAVAAAGVTKWFAFDMSVPDMRPYLAFGTPVFTRHSEVERDPAYYQQSTGVWLDAFEDEWFDEAVVDAHLASGKQLCLVSPELHRRPHLPFWDRLAAWPAASSSHLMLCTDFPDVAQRAFHG
ncbi:MAG: hypothetical protein H0W68_13255 [Gemmatimonadaceae bacterium]|nr:hypothetical protein [Gemmatimonadaceae bacterium]